MNRFALLMLILAAGTASAETAIDWPARASADLRAMHDDLRDNHPGLAEPVDPVVAAWLEDGLRAAEDRARVARGPGDWERALRGYANGLADGHVSVRIEPDAVPRVWPGFLTRTEHGVTTVTATAPDLGALLGLRIAACDGVDIPTLLARRVDPFRVNREVAPSAARQSPWLLVGDAEQPLPLACEAVSGGGSSVIALAPRPIAPDELARWIDAARGEVRAAGPALTRTDGVWFVSLPSFNLFGDAAAPMRALIERLHADAAELRDAPFVVFDVRGNTGGNSGWGHRVAAALYGENAVEQAEGSFDWTVDWRASPANLARVKEAAALERSSGVEDTDADKVIAGLEAALRVGQALYRESEPPRSAPSAESPMRGRVFLLTDGACGSACLDFADLLLHLPRVTQIGLPTYADTIYLDTNTVALPSGARFTYPMKVYRHHVRANNGGYAPRFAWPGGPIETDAVARWVKTLP